MCLGAAVLHPYFVLPVLVISAPYLIRRLIGCWQRGVLLGGVIAAGTLGISVLLGYLSVGASFTNAGYGDFAADLAFLANAQGSSKLMPALPYAPVTWEGIGFLGTGVLLVLVAAVCAVLLRRFTPTLSMPVVTTGLACVTLALFAAWPTLHFAGRTVVDLTGSPLSLDFLGNIYRTNGRFVWSLTWLVALGAFAVVLAARWSLRVLLSLLVAACVLQLLDGQQYKFVDRGDADYEVVSAVLVDQRSRGASRIEVQPPWIEYDCPHWDVLFDDLAPIILAAAVWELPINSGYPARPAPGFASEICSAQAKRFAAGQYEPDVLYVVNQANPATAQLACQPLIHVLLACRSS